MSTATNLTLTTSLLTAEEFVRQYAGDYVELIDGRVVELHPMPKPRHGRVCTKVSRYLDEFVEAKNLGAVCSNDTFVLVARDPDRVRGPDVVYWPRSKLPDGHVPEKGLILTPPDLAVEVVSPSNDWAEIYTKVGEYLRVGVPIVLVLDPDSKSATTYRLKSGQQTFEADEDLTLPEVLPGFSIRVGKFFE